MKRNKFFEDLIIGGVLFTLSSIAYLLIYYDLHKNFKGEYGFSPATFPLMAMGSMIILSICLFASTLYKRVTKKSEDPGTERLDRAQVKQVATILFILIIYIGIINMLGFYLSTILANVALMLLLKVKNWFRISVSSAILILSIFLFFEKGMNITFPRGFLF